MPPLGASTYALRKDMWAFHGNRIAVRFQYECHDASGQWYRSHGNELWEFDGNGLMRRREASINDVPMATACLRRPGAWRAWVNQRGRAAVVNGSSSARSGDRMTAPRARGSGTGWRLAGIGLLAIGVAAAVYVVGRLHQPDYAFSMFGADPVPRKSLLATIVLGLAALQVLLALWMYRKLPLAARPPRPVPVAHRAAGFALFALTVPIAVHCLIAYGVRLTSLRVAIHSIAGCFFYGAFTAKVLLVHSRRLPGWALPAAGGTLVAIVGVLWYTSALWYFNGYQLPHL